jgi:hypothetical protein
MCAGFCNGLDSGQCFFPGAETTCHCDLLNGTCDKAGACMTALDLCF